MLERERVSLTNSKTDDVCAVIEKVRPKVEEIFSPESPQSLRVFWDQQTKFNRLKNKKQMRWHPLVTRFAMNLKNLSTSANQTVHEGGVINLPSERTLFDDAHRTSPHHAVQLKFVKVPQVPHNKSSCCSAQMYTC